MPEAVGNGDGAETPVPDRAQSPAHEPESAGPGAPGAARPMSGSPPPERPRVYRIPPGGSGRRLTSRGRIRLARTIAIAADALQILVFPLFFGGAVSPLADILDVAMAALMVGLLGWHWAFLPTFVAEVVPVLDLFPTWSAAVFFVTRRGANEDEEVGPPR
jgi:hypothetical protein